MTIGKFNLPIVKMMKVKLQNYILCLYMMRMSYI